MNNRKVVIIGDGNVGSATAFTLMQNEAVNEIVIIDYDKRKAEGDVMDMVHGMSFVSPKMIKAGDYADCANAHIIIITAGARQKDGETRLDLLKRNIIVFDSIIESMRPYVTLETIVLVVTNPVDILSYYTYKKLGLPSKHVIGSGTVLDTARLKFAIGEDTHIDPRSVHTFVLGEHGDSEVAAFSVTSVGGLSINDYCDKCGVCADHGSSRLEHLHNQVKNAAYEIIQRKGATYYAIALAVNRIVETILNNQNSILTVSNYVENEFNGLVKDIYFSLPCVVNSDGVERIIHPNYSIEEISKLVASGEVLRKQIELLNI